MTVKELREFINSLPEELDMYEVVYSQVEILNKEDGTWARKDIPLGSVIADQDHEELIIATKGTVDAMLKLSGQAEDEE